MKVKKIVSMTFSLTLGLGLIFIILSQSGLKNLKVYLNGLNYWWILFALSLYTIDMLIRAYRWKQILNDSHISISLKDSFLAYNLGNSLNILIPAKVGDVARAYYLKKRWGHDYSNTLPSIFLDRFFDILGVGIVIFITGIYVLKSVNMPQWFYNLVFTGIILLTVVFFMIEGMVKLKYKLPQIKIKWIGSAAASLIDALEGSIENKGKFFKLTMCSILIWLCDGLFTFFVFVSMGNIVNPFAVIFANMVATLTKIFPITPGGIGVFEGTMVVVFSLLGFDSNFIGVLSTLDHFLMNIYTISAGIYGLVRYGIKFSDIESERMKD